MARPRKARFYAGVELEPNLYAVPSRPGYWRYVRLDGSSRCFSESDVHRANRVAAHNNAKRAQPRDSLAWAVGEYIEYREKQDPNLKSKASWRNRTYALRGLGEVIDAPIQNLRREHLSTWWDSLTYHQQKQRRAEFRKLFSWMMGEGLVNLQYNPFTKDDSLPQLMNTGVPDKQRERMTRDQFWAIYAGAGQLEYFGLQIAMGISLITFMREGDICSLKLRTHLEGDLLKLVVGKSLAQKGAVGAARLQWDVGNHRLLRGLLARSRELSMRNRRCPFVVSHTPKSIRPSKKEHSCQVLPRMLISQFSDARELAGVTGQHPPTFHEIRSLASKLATDAGHRLSEIQMVMAHEREETTKGYQEGHELPFDPVEVVFTQEMIGGEF